MAKLMGYSWPGNIRELQNVLEKAVVLAKSEVLDVADLDLETARTLTNLNLNDTDISPAFRSLSGSEARERVSSSDAEEVPSANKYDR